jgi:hypothetical protein
MRKAALLKTVQLTALFLAVALLSSCGQSQSSSVAEACDKPGELWTTKDDQIAICVGGEGKNQIFVSGDIFESVRLLGNLALVIPGGSDGIPKESLSKFKESIGLSFIEGNELDRRLLSKVISNAERWDSIREGLAAVDLAEVKLTDVYRNWCPDFNEAEPYCLPKTMGELGLEKFFQADNELSNAYEELYPKLKVLEMDLKERFEIQDINTAVELYLTTYAERK